VVVFPVELPPLRKRCEDIPALIEHFARQICAQNGWKPVAFASAAIEALQRYGWPGNIRELRNIVERLLLLAEGEVDAEAVRLALPASNGHRPESAIAAEGPLAQRVLAFERAQVLAELERHHRQVTQTAKALGLERSHLYKKCQQLGIDLAHLPPGDSSAE
jgi:two-component system, NtrC family, nitrogen regulation response regulator NtrX